LFLAVALLSAAAATHASEIFRVDSASGSDEPDCGSEITPCQSIQYAVDLAVSGDSIRVAAGTYTYTGDPDCSAVLCVYAKELAITGGFSPTDWEISDPLTNLTEIDGEDLRRGVDALKGGPAGKPTKLDMRGFTIKRGLVLGSARDAFGGGLRVSNADLVLQDVVFQNNVAKGSTATSGAGNAGAGGGLHISSCPDRTPTVPTADLHRVSFLENRALGGDGPERGGVALGGGMYALRARVTGQDLQFETNEATAGNSTGSGLYGGVRADALGGAVHFGAATLAVLSDLVALDNTADGGNGTDHGGFAFGGGVFAEGKAVVDEVPGCPTPTESLATQVSIVGANIIQNEAAGGSGSTGGGAKGGGVASFRATLNLDRVQLIANGSQGGTGSATGGEAAGGGAMIEHPDADGSVLSNTVVADNTVDGGSGGGGGVRFLGADGTLSHTTVARNTIAPIQIGQGILIGPRSGEPSDIQIEYSLVSDHTGIVPERVAVRVMSDASATFNRGLFAANDHDTNDGDLNSGDFFGLSSVTASDSAGYASPGTPDFDYHLAAGSAAIDGAIASDMEEDFDHQTRPGNRDFGADEWCSVGSADVSLADETVTTSVTERACNTVSAEDYTITSSGDALLQAGIGVALGDGVTVETGGTLTVICELP
jgi:hypothetical protein